MFHRPISTVLLPLFHCSVFCTSVQGKWFCVKCLNGENESRTQTSFSCECSDRFRLNPVLLQYSAQLSDPSKMWTGWDGKRFDSPSVVRSREASSLTDGPLIDLHCLFLLKAAWPNVTCPFIIHTMSYKQTNLGSIHQVFVCVSKPPGELL